MCLSLVGLVIDGVLVGFGNLGLAVYVHHPTAYVNLLLLRDLEYLKGLVCLMEGNIFFSVYFIYFFLPLYLPKVLSAYLEVGNSNYNNCFRVETRPAKEQV